MSTERLTLRYLELQQELERQQADNRYKSRKIEFLTMQLEEMARYEPRTIAGLPPINRPDCKISSGRGMKKPAPAATKERKPGTARQRVKDRINQQLTEV